MVSLGSKKIYLVVALVLVLCVVLGFIAKVTIFQSSDSDHQDTEHEATQPAGSKDHKGGSGKESKYYQPLPFDMEGTPASTVGKTQNTHTFSNGSIIPQGAYQVFPQGSPTGLNPQNLHTRKNSVSTAHIPTQPIVPSRGSQPPVQGAPPTPTQPPIVPTGSQTPTSGQPQGQGAGTSPAGQNPPSNLQPAKDDKDLFGTILGNSHLLTQDYLYSSVEKICKRHSITTKVSDTLTYKIDPKDDIIVNSIFKSHLVNNIAQGLEAVKNYKNPLSAIVIALALSAKHCDALISGSMTPDELKRRENNLAHALKKVSEAMPTCQLPYRDVQACIDDIKKCSATGNIKLARGSNTNQMGNSQIPPGPQNANVVPPPTKATIRMVDPSGLSAISYYIRAGILSLRLRKKRLSLRPFNSGKIVKDYFQHEENAQKEYIFSDKDLKRFTQVFKFKIYILTVELSTKKVTLVKEDLGSAVGAQAIYLLNLKNNKTNSYRAIVPE